MWVLKVSNLNFLLTVPSGPPFVNLGASPETVRGGDNVNLTCTVLGEPEVDVSFSWSYPGQVREQSQNSIIQKEQVFKE